jgi:predicted ester cyclase
MSKGYEDAYRGYLACFSERRLDGLGDFVHDSVSINGEEISLADYKSFIASNLDVVPDLQWDLQDLVVQENRIAARFKDTGTPRAPWLGFKPTGKSVTFQEWAFYHFRDGKVAEIWSQLDMMALQAQLGDQES